MQAYELEYYIYFIILGLGFYYLYKAGRQISKKDFDFFKKEIYTKESIEKWAVVDGLLKVFASLVFVAYGAFGLAGIKIVWAVILLIVVDLVLYFWFYSKVLKKKEDY